MLSVAALQQRCATDRAKPARAVVRAVNQGPIEAAVLQQYLTEILPRP